MPASLADFLVTPDDTLVGEGDALAPFLATPADFAPLPDGVNKLTRARSIPEAEKFEAAGERMFAAEVASRRQSWTGRFEERLAKTALGQTLLRAEQGFGDVARGAVSLGARAAGAESVADNIHHEKRVREAWLSEIEKGGDVEALLGPTGSKIYSGVTKSLAQMSPGAKLAGAAGVYSTIGGVAYDDGLEEAKQLGLTGGADVAYAGKKAIWEMGVTHLMGAVGKKFGLESLEESLTPGLRNAASKIGERIGIVDKLKQLVGGAALEGAEEAIVDAGQQAIELAEKPDARFDWERTLLAGLTGVAARGVTGITQSLASAKNYVEQTVAGTLAAEKVLRGDDGEVAVNKFLTAPPSNAAEFAAVTGVKRAKPAFREAYLDTMRLYVPAATTSPITPVQLVSETPPAITPSSLRPSIVWDESGALHLPDITKPIAHGVSDAFTGVRGFRERFTNSLETQLGVVAERAPEHLRANAKAAAQAVVAKGQRVLEAGRSIAGRLQPLYHKVRRRAGSASFINGAWEAQQDGETVAAPDGSAVGGDTVLMQLVEQKRPLAGAHPDLAAFVNDVVALNDARGRMYESMGNRRPVPQSRLAERLATLGRMSDNELKAEYRALFPKLKTVLTSRAKLIEKLQSIEFFKNKGGNVWQRIGTPLTHEIRALGEAHRLWLPLSKLIAAKTGQTLESVNVDMRSHFMSAEKKHSIEVPRELEWYPAWIETNGRREWLLETHPAAHAQKVHEDFTQRMGNLAVFGDPLAEPATGGERITPQDAMRNAAVQAGLPPNLVDAYFNALAGLPTDRNVVEQGESTQATTPWKALYNLILAGKLTASAAYGVVEPLGTMRRMAGIKRIVKAYDAQIRRGRHADVLNDIRRGGAFASEYANFTFNRQAFMSGLAGQMSDVALTGSLARPFWNQNAEMSALLGWQIARDFEAGIASKGDRDMLVRDLGYTRAEADAFFNRRATQADYDGLIQRFASRTTTAKITNPAEESAVRALGIGKISGGAFRALIPFSRYSLFKSREAANIVRSMKDNWALARQGDTEAPARLARDLYSAGDFVVGGAFAGLAGNLLRHLVFYGPEEGFGLWWEDIAPTEGNPFRPLAAAAKGFVANGLGFIGGNLFWALGEKGLDNVQEAILGVSPGSGVFVEGLQALGSLVAIEGGSKLGYGRYRKAASGLDVFTTWVAANAPGLRAAANFAGDIPVVGAYLAPLAYGSRDQELDAARIRLFRWLDEQGYGPPNGSPGNVPPEQANFMRHMRAFQMEARKEEPMSTTRKAALREHLQNAFGTRTNTPQEVRQRILDMRLLKYIPNDELRAQFAKEYPERFRKLAQHDMGLEAWANFAYRPK